MENQRPFTVLVLMNATPKWLSLTREERSAYMENEVVPIFTKVSETVKIRLFDSEYFHATFSDFMIIETHKLGDYQELMERLRDTKIYGVPYFDIKEIVIGQENRFEDFNEQFKNEQQ